MNATNASLVTRSLSTFHRCHASLGVSRPEIQRPAQMSCSGRRRCSSVPATSPRAGIGASDGRCLLTDKGSCLPSRSCKLRLLRPSVAAACCARLRWRLQHVGMLLRPPVWRLPAPVQHLDFARLKEDSCPHPYPCPSTPPGRCAVQTGGPCWDSWHMRSTIQVDVHRLR
ncbi:hypothetical protein BAUCODRAFT_347474 [Baudoinia panamericana UAMH 10762]|uniref:Uncharacterized protein n=1 Tax=Baudoinia panamericana (strain UAMH 10762) TaxID=717646 RepID=M2LYC3_BAUPA|nr:uncharacterized protein BAUCODRAFT_347474 [Baudoinia panamericana UAMH 10762]EMC99707.1 hypothetical protein BAUCODRAFT_347474 [Baudoinia panamericana UAMH 10762]